MTTTPVLPVVGYIGPRGQMRQARWMEEDAPVCRVSDALAAIAATQAVATPASQIAELADTDQDGSEGITPLMIEAHKKLALLVAAQAAQPTDAERYQFLRDVGAGFSGIVSGTGSMSIGHGPFIVATLPAHNSFNNITLTGTAADQWIDAAIAANRQRQQDYRDKLEALEAEIDSVVTASKGAEKFHNITPATGTQEAKS